MPNDVLSVLGTRLKAARKGRDLTQERLAELSGVSARHIAKIEKGDVNPSFEVLSTLVKTLGVSFDAIFDPASEQVEAEIQEVAGLYRACPEQERRLMLAVIRTMLRELMGEAKD
jgi:transcriptional regulator with XRE-family HTH domain